ncbi:MAG: hypothetical protein LUD51_02580 [Clostridia bacterium]|nr:hypothetical protein [Clostridia bacterium]
MNTIAARVSLAAALAMAAVCSIAGFAACTVGKAEGQEYRTEYRTAEEYFAADVPVRAIKDETEYTELGIGRVIVDLTIREDSFRLSVEDVGSGTKDTAWDRAYIVTGRYESAEENVYSLTEATSVTRRQKNGSHYYGAYGKTGSMSSKKDPSLLDMFTPCTAILDANKVTYAFIA